MLKSNCSYPNAVCASAAELAAEDALLDDLDAMSKEMGKKKTAIVSEALEMYMDYQDIQLAKKRLNDSTGTITHDELLKELGI